MKKIFILVLISVFISAQAFALTWSNGGGGGGGVVAYTIGTLPAAPADGDVAVITDGANTSDCTVAGGAWVNLCIYDAGGTAWVIAGDGTSAGAGSGSVTTLQEAGTPVGDADIVTINFDVGFTLAESPDTLVKVSYDLAPGTGSATMIATDDALQVKYDTTDFTEGPAGLLLGASPTITGSPVIGVALLPDAAGGAILGSATAEWQDLYLGDSAVIYGQLNSLNTLTSSATGWTAALNLSADAFVPTTAANATGEIGFTGGAFTLFNVDDALSFTNATNVWTVGSTGDTITITPATTITGAVVASTSVDITGAAGLILQNDETITNAVNGTIQLDGILDLASLGITNVGAIADDASFAITGTAAATVTVDSVVFNAGAVSAVTTLAMTGAQTGVTAITMGSATVDTGVLTMIKGAQTSDPQTTLTMSADGVGALTIATANGSNGDITLTPSGGDTIFTTDITVSGGDIKTGAVALVVGDGTTTSITLNTDGTGDAEIVLENDSVGDAEIDWEGLTASHIFASPGITLTADSTLTDASPLLTLQDSDDAAGEGRIAAISSGGDNDVIFYLATEISTVTTDFVELDGVSETIDLLKPVVTSSTSDLSAGNVTLGVVVGTVDAGGATAFQIPNGTANPTSVTGNIALDTNGTDANYTGPVLAVSTDGATMGYVVTMTDMPEEAEDNYIMKYNADSNLMVWEVDVAGDTPALNAVTDPTGAWSVTLQDTEVVTWTSEQDTAGSVFTIDNTDAAVGNQVYLLDLAYSVDDAEANADYIIARDAGGTVFTLSQDGDIVTQGDADVVGDFTAGTIASDAALSGTTITGTAKISTTATTEQLRLNYDATNYAAWTVDATGATTVTTVDNDGALAHLTFSPNGTIILTPATDVIGAFTAGSVVSDAGVSGTVLTASTSLVLTGADADPGAAGGTIVYDNAITDILDGGALRWNDTGAAGALGVRLLVDLDTDPSDDGYVVSYDATADKFVMSAAGAGDVLADASVPFTGDVAINSATPALTLTDTDSADGTAILSFQATGANEIVASLQTDVAGTPTTYIELDGVTATIDLLQNTVLTGTFTDGTATLTSGAWSALTTIGASGDITTTEDLVIGDAKYIGSTSDKLAIQIAANGEVTLTDELQAGAGINIGTAQAIVGTTSITLGAGEAVVVNAAAWDVSGTGTATGMEIDATTNTITNIGDGEMTTGVDAAKIGDGSVSNAEFQRLDGLTADLATSLATGTITLTGAIALNGDSITSDGVLVINATSSTSFNDEDISNVGLINVDTIDADGASLAIGTGSDQTVSIDSSAWTISTAGVVAGLGTIGSGAITSTGAVTGTSLAASAGIITSTHSAPAVTMIDNSAAAGTGGITFASSGAYDVIGSIYVDVAGSATEYVQIDGVSETVDMLKPLVGTDATFTGTTTVASLAMSGSAAPQFSFQDSDAAGTATADEESAKIMSNMTTTTEDAEVSDLWFTNMQAGTTTTVMLFDGSANSIEAEMIINAEAGMTVSNEDTTAGFIDFYEDSDDGSNYVKLIAPALAGNITLTLPNTDGDNTNILATNGSGVMYWTSAGAATAWHNLVIPADDETLNMAGYTTQWTWTETAADMFSIFATGAFGDVSVMLLDQNTGAATNGTMLEIVTEAAGVDHLVLALDATPGGAAEDYVTHKITTNGTYTIDVTSDGTAAVDFVDGVTVGSLVSDSTISVGTILNPDTDGGASLGTVNTLEWQNLFMNTGAVINFENSDVTLTHSANTLTLGGGALDLTSGGITNSGTIADDGAISVISSGSTVTIESVVFTGGALSGVTAITGLTTPLAANLGGTGVANNAASTITISGNYGTTFTVTEATSVTLPASGTLATTDAETTALAGLTFADASVIQLTGASAAAVLTSGGNNYILGSSSDNTALEFKTPANVLSEIGAAATAQTFYIGETQVAINRASAGLTLAGITLTTPDIGAATGTSLDISGAAGLVLQNDETITNASDGAFLLSRNDSGIVTITAADDDANAALTVVAGGTGKLTLGNATNTDISIVTDGVDISEAELIILDGITSSTAQINYLDAADGETGSGSVVFDDTPTLITPVIGAATGTSLNVTASVVAAKFIQGGIAQYKDGAADGDIAALDDTASDGSDGDPLVLTSAEMMGNTITNLGAGGALYFLLPAAAIGHNAIFNVDVAQNIFLKPPSGTKFYFKDYDDAGFTETTSADKDIQCATTIAIGDRAFVQARKVGATIQYFVWSDSDSCVFEAE